MRTEAHSDEWMSLAGLAMIASAACWGLATVMSKDLLDHFPPLTLLTIQLIVSVVALWTGVAAAGIKLAITTAEWRLAAAGLLEPGFSYILGISGLALTGAAHASFIAATEPILVISIAWLALGLRPSRAAFAALILATAGVAMITATGAADDRNTVVGDLLVLTGTLFAAAYVVVVSRMHHSVHPIKLAAMQQSVGLAFIALTLAVALAVGLERPVLHNIPGSIWLMAAASGIVQYALAFCLYLYGVRGLQLSTAVFALTLVPVFGAGGAVLFLGESLSPIQIIGALLTLGAVAATARQRTVSPAYGRR